MYLDVGSNLEIVPTVLHITYSSPKPNRSKFQHCPHPARDYIARHMFRALNNEVEANRRKRDETWCEGCWTRRFFSLLRLPANKH